MSLLGETFVVRIRPRAARLFLPTVVLGAAAFLLAFFAESIKLTSPELWYLIASGLVFLFWLLPILSYLFSYLELTTQRLIYRYGFLGFRRTEVYLADLQSIQIQRPGALSGKVLSLLMMDEREIIISGYARTKLLAAEIERLARAAE
ncbi:MAG: hypothetical protein ACKOXT_00685 [Actinomycetota bacterium]